MSPQPVEPDGMWPKGSCPTLSPPPPPRSLWEQQPSLAGHKPQFLPGLCLALLSHLVLTLAWVRRDRLLRSTSLSYPQTSLCAPARVGQGGGVPSRSMFAAGFRSCSLRLPAFIYLGSREGGRWVGGGAPGKAAGSLTWAPPPHSAEG